MVVGRPVAVRAALAVARNRAIDDVGLQVLDRVEADAKPIRRARAHVVQHHVSGPNQPTNGLQAVRLLEIDGQRTFVGVLAEERGRQAFGVSGAQLIA